MRRIVEVDEQEQSLMLKGAGEEGRAERVLGLFTTCNCVAVKQLSKQRPEKNTR